MNEEGFVSLALAGDTAAFGALVRLHQSRLRGFLRRLARGDHALADDIAQETFLDAWRHIGQFRGEGSFAGWLMQIAYRRFLMAMRRRKIEFEMPDGELPDTPVDCSPDARIDLEQAMANLSLPERASLTLCYALGYTSEESARMLEIPLGTLKSHVARGRKKLQAMLKAI
jgi:RNA polymerase sigma-70 factor (ECF subfamily)